MKKLLGVIAGKCGIALSIALIAFSQLLVQPIYAISQNDLNSIRYNTPFYDPTAQSCSASTVSQTVGTDTAQKIYQFLVGKGLSAVSASAVIGNLQVESGLNPRIIEGSAVQRFGIASQQDNMPDQIRDPNGPPTAQHPENHAYGYGLVQWTTYGRQQGLVDAAKAAGTNQGDLGTQLDYLWTEMSGNYKNALADLKNNQSVDGDNKDGSWEGSASVLWMKEFESPQDTANTRNARHGAAKDAYDKFHTLSGSYSQCGRGSTNFLTGFIEYKQCDDPTTNFKAPWQNAPYGNNTVCSVGCAPSALAMVITNLTGQRVTPDITAKYAHDNGADARDEQGNTIGSNRSIPYIMLKNPTWGLQVKQEVGVGVSGDYGEAHPDKIIDAIRTGLQQGALVLAASKIKAQYIDPKSGYDPKSGFTDVGHYLVIRAVTADGHWLYGNSITYIGNDLKNNDPQYQYDPATVLSHSISHDGFSAWIITKK